MVAKIPKPLSNSEVSNPNSRQGDGTITLSDGTVVPYRPIQPADESALQRFHDQLSSEKRSPAVHGGVTAPERAAGSLLHSS